MLERYSEEAKLQPLYFKHSPDAFLRGKYGEDIKRLCKEIGIRNGHEIMMGEYAKPMAGAQEFIAQVDNSNEPAVFSGMKIKYQLAQYLNAEMITVTGMGDVGNGYAERMERFNKILEFWYDNVHQKRYRDMEAWMEFTGKLVHFLSGKDLPLIFTGDFYNKKLLLESDPRRYDSYISRVAEKTDSLVEDPFTFDIETLKEQLQIAIAQADDDSTRDIYRTWLHNVDEFYGIWKEKYERFSGKQEDQ